MEGKKKVFNPQVETKLKRDDFNRLTELARSEKRTKSEIVREAVLYYLDNQEQLKNNERETLIAQSINGMSNRVAAMLARQGRLLATLFELTYVSMSQTEEGKEAFNAALTKAKQKMAKSVEQDERDMVEKMKRVIKGKPVEADELA